MRLLLTGATGFVGRNVLLQAIRDGRYAEIVVPVRSIEKLRQQFLGDGFDGVPALVKPLLACGPEWTFRGMSSFEHVVHSAGLLFGDNPRDYTRGNVDSTLSLLATLEGDPRIVILSSQAASGPCAGEEEKTETDPDVPVTWYGKSKLEMERRVRAEHPSRRVLFLRPPVVLGPRDTATLPLFQLASSPVRVKPGLGPKQYSFIGVADLSRAIFAALDASDWSDVSQRTFFVAACRPMSDRELMDGAGGGGPALTIPIPLGLVRAVSEIIDRVPAWRRRVPSLTRDRVKEIFPDRWVVSPKAFESRFHWKATDDLPTVLKATREWYVRTGKLR